MQKPSEIQGDHGGKSLVELRDQVGLVDSFRLNRALSREASQGLREMGTLEIRSAVKIKETAIGYKTQTICAAIAAREAPVLGAIITQLNSACAAVDEAVTEASKAEVVGHVQCRTRERLAFERLKGSGQVDGDEEQVLLSMAEEDFVTKVKRSRKRMRAALGRTDQLYDRVLAGIQPGQSDIAE